MKFDQININRIYETDYSSELYLVLEKNNEALKTEGILIFRENIKKNYEYHGSMLRKEYNILDYISPNKIKLVRLIENIQIEYMPIAKKFLFNNVDFKISDLALTKKLTTKSILKHVEKEYEKHKELLETGSNINVENVILADVEPEININTSGEDITSQYASIVGNVSQITKDINAGHALDDHKEIVEAFLKAKVEISKLSTVTPSKFGYFGKWLTDNKIIKSTTEDIKETKARQQSTQENIDYLFGVVYEKYENLIITGEGLQKSKIQMDKQIEALQELEKQSDDILSHYQSQSDIPIRDLAINTQIKTSIEKYKQRLTKIDGAIIATQTTITSLAKDLPAMKNDLTDEMAISSLLGSVDDYQVMYGEIAKLVSEVTTSTAEKTHVVIENLLQMQIEDTHTINYLVESGKRAEKLSTMLTDKTGKLAKKVKRDADFIADIAQGNTIEHARSKYKLLK